MSAADDLVAGDTNAASDVFVRDRDPNDDGLDGPDAATARVSLADDESEATGASGLGRVDISADGRYVAFDSLATNLQPAPAMGLNGLTDVFVRDRTSGTTVRVSVTTAGAEASG